MLVFKRLLYSFLGELDQEAVHPTGLAAHVPSHQEVFQIGIIDFLAPYETKKKIANFFKTQIFLPESLSTIPAAAYAKRFIDYLPAIFLTCNKHKPNLKSSFLISHLIPLYLARL